VSPERKPGDPGWKPSEEDVRNAEQPGAGLLLRAVSVVPFVAMGVLGVLALVAWAAVFVFGVGNSNGPVWRWAQGKPPHVVVTQVSLLVLLGLACAGVAGLSVFATAYGFRERQPRHFWPVAEAVFGALLVLLVWASGAHPGVMRELGLSGTQWWFVFVWLAFSMVVVGLRMRRRGHDGGDGAGGRQGE
jgi:hypothetical protein